MKTKELIAKLRELDPTGEKSIWVTDRHYNEYYEPSFYIEVENEPKTSFEDIKPYKTVPLGDIVIN